MLDILSIQLFSNTLELLEQPIGIDIRSTNFKLG